jgi:hypothetical protein
MLFNEINKICVDKIIISFHSLANIGTKEEENNKIVQKGRLLMIQASIIKNHIQKHLGIATQHKDYIQNDKSSTNTSTHQQQNVVIITSTMVQNGFATMPKPTQENNKT